MRRIEFYGCAAAAVLVVGLGSTAHARVSDPCTDHADCAEGSACYLGACFELGALECGSDNECFMDLGVQVVGAGICLKDGAPVQDAERGFCQIVRDETCTHGDPADLSRSFACPSNAVCADYLGGNACWFPANICREGDLCADDSGICVSGGNFDICIRRPLCEYTEDDPPECFDEGAQDSANPECDVMGDGEVVCPDGDKADDVEPGSAGSSSDEEGVGCSTGGPRRGGLLGLILLLPVLWRRR